MTDREALKQKVLDFIHQQDPTALISETDKQALRDLIEQLVPHTPVPDPIHQQEQAAGVWVSLFASFGAKHSDDQPLEHTTNLAVLSFGNLPAATVHTTAIHQEIDAASKAYNNVIYIDNEERSAHAVLVVHGTYSADQENPQRYSVAFTGVSLHGADGQSDDELREQFSLEPDAPLKKAFKPPALHSDIVYLDEDLRINFGGLKGFYVLLRAERPAFSLALSAAA
jgi:hypothetical protein